MRSLPGLDLDELEPWLADQHPGLAAGSLRAGLIAGGKSNLTYRVTDSEHVWALRRPPLGHVLPSAHDMGREFRVLTGLASVGFPVPEPIGFCADPGVLGAPFYLMDFVDGIVLDSASRIDALSTTAAASAGGALVGTLAALHAVDPDAAGLAEFGRPDGFLQRQVRRWAAQWEASLDTAEPAVADLASELSGAAPTSSRASIVHGDYRLTNVIFDRPVSRVAAVVDWEMATLGDPLTDVGLLLAYHRLAQHNDVIMPLLRAQSGFPAPADLLEQYATATGYDVAGIDWYVAFGNFKLAAISAGIAARHAQGNTVGDGFADFAGLVPHLVDQARAHLSGARSPH